jgi:galactokinase/mevalonate kinase-like predicted kinase
VYVADATGQIRTFLQKPTIDESRDAGAIDPEGFVLVDTGVVSLSARAALQMLNGAERGGARSLMSLAERGRMLDLYDHVLIGLLGGMPAARFAAKYAADHHHSNALTHLWQAMRGLTSAVRVAPQSRFLHVGTTRELLERLGPGFAAEGAGFKGIGSRGLVLHSAVGRIAGRGSHVVENCATRKPVHLAGDNVLVGVPAEWSAPIRLRKGIGLVVLPIGARDWTAVVFGDRDDFKTAWNFGGTFLNRPCTWSAPGTTLWDASLWKVGSLTRVMNHVRGVLRSQTCAEEKGLCSAGWIMVHVNHARLVGQREQTQRLDRLKRLPERMGAHAWLSADDIVQDAASSAERAMAGRRLVAASIGQPTTARARLLYCASVLMRASGRHRAAAELQDDAFRAVADSVTGEVALERLDGGPQVLADQVVWATCPARVDLGGGWTDTPPICTDVGGFVVNAAVTINGQYPLQAICRLTPEPMIRVSSIDLGATRTFRTTESLRQLGDPHDWAALAKAALVLTGFAPAEGKSLAHHLSRFGAGLDVTLFSALPKGSGMGASSILGATIIAALRRVRGLSTDHETIIESASVLEQYMSTGGGWQDQAGGVLAGVKLLCTRANERQIPKWLPIASPSALEGEEARARCLLYFTGQRRLARNILRNVVGRYLARDARTRAAINLLKASAHRMSEDLARGDLDSVGASLSDYATAKRMMDEGSTTPQIEAMFERIKPWVAGRTLLGAGGGGFAFIIARDARSAARVRKELTRQRGSPLARFYDWSVDTTGVKVTTL